MNFLILLSVFLNLMLESKKDTSAPGIDGIDFDIIKRLCIKLKLILLDINNKLFFRGTFLDSWRDTFLLLIRKLDGEELCPLSLTSYC